MDQSESDTIKLSRDKHGFFKCNQCPKKYFTKTVFEAHIMKEWQLKKQSIIKTEQMPVQKDKHYFYISQ